MSHGGFQVTPIVSYPRRAVAGQTYLLTVDFAGAAGPEAWPFSEEEYAIYCLIDGRELFSSRPLASAVPAVVLHRFGGSYGPAQFLITAGTTAASGQIWLQLVTGWGAPIGGLSLEVEVVPEAAPDELRGTVAMPVNQPRARQGQQAHQSDEAPPQQEEAVEVEPPRTTVDTFAITVGERVDDGWGVTVGSFDAAGYQVMGYVGERLRAADLLERVRSLVAPADAGRFLGELLFRDDIAEGFRAACVTADGQIVSRLRIRLQLRDPELASLPWEHLHVPFEGRTLHVLEHGPFTFAVVIEPRAARTYSPPADMRALAFIASPEELDKYGLEIFDVASVLEPVGRALWSVPLETIADNQGELRTPSLAQLTAAIVRNRPSILHFCCRVRVLPEPGTVLYLGSDDSPGRVEPVTLERLVEQLGRVGELSLPRLVVLAAPPRAYETDGRKQIAIRLVRDLGVPAVLVLATPAQLSDRFVERFYEVLLQTGEVFLAAAAAARILGMGLRDSTIAPYVSAVRQPPLFIVETLAADHAVGQVPQQSAPSSEEALATATAQLEAQRAVLGDAAVNAAIAALRAQVGAPAQEQAPAQLPKSTPEARAPLVLVSGSPDSVQLITPLGITLDGEPLLTIDAATVVALAKSSLSQETREQINLYNLRRRGEGSGNL